MTEIPLPRLLPRRRSRPVILPLLTALAVAAAAPAVDAQTPAAPPPPAPVAAPVAEAPPAPDAPRIEDGWCELDAPGTFAEARHQARAARRADADSSATPTCPDPAPAETLPDMLVVPLPCGRAMTFMRVDTPVASVLDDREMAFGGAAGDTSLRARYSRGRWDGAVAGTFTRAAAGGPAHPDLSDLGARVFYMGAYEVTALQYALFTSGVLAAYAQEARPSADDAAALCAAHRAEAADTRYTKVMPASGLSWFDAIAFVRAVNAYIGAESARRLAEGHGPLLPWEKGSPGFIRLPAEEEWEYAARGGATGVADATADSVTYQVRDGDGQTLRSGTLSEIAIASDGTSVADVSGVGRKAPNLIGLYDTIGNVAEITHDLFRMTRPDRLQGVRGGFVVRGGHVLTPRTNLGVSHRQEEPLYDARGEGRTAYTGLRLAVVAPVFVNGASADDPYRTDLRNTEFDVALEKAHERLTAAGFTPGAEYRQTARDLVSGLRDAASVTEMEARLAKLEESLESSEAALNSAARRELEEKLRSAAIGAVAVRSLGRLAYTIRLRIEEHGAEVETKFPAGSKERAEAVARLEQLEANWRKLESQTALQIRQVLRTAAEVGRAPAAALAEALVTVEEGFVAQNLDDYLTTLGVIRAVFDDVKAGDTGDLFAKYAEQLDDNRAARAKRFNIDLGRL